MILNKLLYFIAALFFSFATSAAAADWQNDKIEIDIYSQYDFVTPQTPYQILVQATLKNGWHISYDNPGDAGTPIKFDWQMPAHVSVVKLNQSVPEKFLYEGIITQYGYGHKAYFLFDVTPSENDQNLHLKLKISWAACRDYCEPEEAVFEINLPEISEKNQISGYWTSVISDARKTFPIPHPLTFTATNRDGRLFVRVHSDFKDIQDGDAFFIPHERGITFAGAEQLIHHDEQHKLSLEIEAESDRLPQNGGLLVVKDKAYLLVYEQNSAFSLQFAYFLFLAFVAGLILNLMPCVFPILSLKALSLTQNVYERKHFKQGFLYICGVLSSFILIAAVLYLLRRGGEAVGWGFQLQSPIFVGCMLIVFTIILLLMLDVIHFGNSLAAWGEKLSRANAFLTGFFAVLIATPCTAPLMGAVLSYALFQPARFYFPIFISLGLGYALPFALIEMYPAFLRAIMPKPGKWMVTLKKVLALPIFLTCLWLAWVLFAQLKLLNAKQSGPWQPYNQQAVEAALAEGDPVFIDFTAKWCVTCLFNEKVALDTAVFEQYAANHQIKLFKADWTDKSDTISSALEFYGRHSVPLYVYYPKNGRTFYILPQILTMSILEDYLGRQNQGDN